MLVVNSFVQGSSYFTPTALKGFHISLIYGSRISLMLQHGSPMEESSALVYVLPRSVGELIP